MEVKEEDKVKATLLTDKTQFYAITYSQNILYYNPETQSLRISSVHQAANWSEDKKQE